MIEPIALLLRSFYLLTLAGLALYGCFGLYTVLMFWRMRSRISFVPAGPDEIEAPSEWPAVTIQLPIYNERFVVERLIDAVMSLEYPADRLQIQVLDDSTDDTTSRAAALVERYAGQGRDIELLHRTDRRGYKAGALQAGLLEAKGELLVIFDADFQPRPDFLRQTAPYFSQDPRLGMVQARWGHLNASDSMLTAIQAIALDKHFAVEQSVRCEAALFPKFNGTAGVWRRQSIIDAGGWQDDTVCEDLCLSTRATLRGWRLRFLPNVVAPAELPASMSAFKCQQARWAKGSVQCLLKFAPAIWDSPNRLAARLYAIFSMSAYVTSLLLLILLLLQVPLLILDLAPPRWLILFSIAGIGQPLLFVLGQGLLYRDWPWRIRHLPALVLLAVGMSVAIGRAVLQAVFGRGHVFVRTPKDGLRRLGGERGYRLPGDSGVLFELMLVLYAGVGIMFALYRGSSGSLALLLTCLFGFAYVGLFSLRDHLR